MKKLYVYTDFVYLYDAKPMTFDEWVTARATALKENRGQIQWYPISDQLSDLPWYENQGDGNDTQKTISNSDEFQSFIDDLTEGFTKE